MAAAPVPRTIAADKGRRQRRARAPKASLPAVRSQSLLDVVDTLIDKGLALDTEVVLGLANIDLIYLRAGALLAAADRVFPPKGRRARVRAAGRSPSSRRTMSPAAQPGHAACTSNVVSGFTRTAPRSLRSTEVIASGSAAVAPDEASRSVIRLVLTLVEFVRQLLERQAVRRVREHTLTPDEIERLGTALMQLEATVHELAERHWLDPTDLNLDLGPLGTLR
jgi:hypothetical protein